MMHDWTLVSVLVHWATGIVDITFKNEQSKVVQLIATGFINLHIPRQEDWGSSVSVNEVDGPRLLENGNSYLCLEIQSGDKIELEAKSISLPNYLT
jgi:hypothetical protein